MPSTPRMRPPFTYGNSLRGARPAPVVRPAHRIPTGGTLRANTPVGMVEFSGGYTGGYAGGGYTPRRPHGTQLKKYSTSSLAS